MKGRSGPTALARIAGFFYLLVIVTAPLAMSIRDSLVVRHDGAAAAANILGHEPLYRLGAAADIIGSASYIVVTALFYILFRPVSRGVSLTAMLFSTVAIAVSTVGGLFNLAPLTILHGASYLSAFTDQQVNELVLLSVKLGGLAVNIGIVLFGCYCLTIGWLIYKSAFLPPVLGAGMALAGLGWLTFIYQPLAAALVPFNMISGGLGEGALTLWLLGFGVNAARWKEQEMRGHNT